MGLSISVGLLYDQKRNDPEGYAHHRRAFDRLALALRAEGVDWGEPEITDPPTAHTHSGGFPYGDLMRLRRAYVLSPSSGEAPLPPAPPVDGPAWRRDLERIEDETMMFASHLLCHSDSSGYYVPVDFADPLLLRPESGVAGGGMVGSTHRLLQELDRVAAALGAPDAVPADGDPHAPERRALHQLRAACRAGIAGGHALVFH
ncbi:hypothetical protein ACWD6I_28535 [Streptomyces sp. NPDC002454]